jgi:hypothetical protein
MANNHTSLKSLFRAIADAIRAKKNSSGTIVADTFPDEIESLSGGFNYINHKVTEIPDYAFYNCKELKTVHCYNVTSVGKSAFEGCTNLDAATFYSAAITDMGENAFKGCDGSLSICFNGASEPDWSSLYENNWNPDGFETLCYWPTDVWDISSAEDESIKATLYFAQEGPVNDGLLVIEGSGNMKNFADENDVPWTAYSAEIDNVLILGEITNIGTYAFYGCQKLAFIELPDSVAIIGAKAFKDCSKLASVDIPEYVEIGAEAFSGCTSLGSITLPLCQSISQGTFSDCTSLTSISIPDSTVHIGAEAFSGCASLQAINIPESVTSIDENAFAGCDSITIYCKVAHEPDTWNAEWNPDGCRVLWKGMIECWDVSSIENTDNVTAELYQIEDGSGYRLAIVGTGSMCDFNYAHMAKNEVYSPWHTSNSRIRAVTISDGITRIGAEAFYNTDITTIDIPNSVIAIGHGAFESCDKLTSVVLPAGLKTIGYEAFRLCIKLSNISLPESITSIGGNAFYQTAYFNTATNWESNMLYLDGYLMNVRSGISGNGVIKNGTKLICGGAFRECPGLTGVTIPDSVTGIGDSAFYRCPGLTSITIPNSVTSIGSSVFWDCTGLTSVTIPNSVTSIGGCAFYNCSSLASVTIPDGVTSIEHQTFQKCSSMTSINIPDGVTVIGNSAFNGCTGLTSITIPASLVRTLEGSFNNCTGLTSVHITDVAAWCNATMHHTGNPLHHAKKLYLNGELVTDLVIPHGITEINSYAFKNCDSITSVAIPEGVTNIYAQAFDSCINLIRISIPESTTSISSGAFNNTGITQVTYGGTVSSWNKIRKYSSWNGNTPEYTVYCTDGSIAKDGTVTYFNP